MKFNVNLMYMQDWLEHKAYGKDVNSIILHNVSNDELETLTRIAERDGYRIISIPKLDDCN